MAVRGTVGLLAFVNGITTVGCVACAADSVTVTVGTQTLTLVTGQFLAVSAAGAITTGALGGVIAAFSGAGVPVSGRPVQQQRAFRRRRPAAQPEPRAARSRSGRGGTAIGIAATNKSSPRRRTEPLATAVRRSRPRCRPASKPHRSPVPPAGTAPHRALLRYPPQHTARGTTATPHRSPRRPPGGPAPDDSHDEVSVSRSLVTLLAGCGGGGGGSSSRRCAGEGANAAVRQRRHLDSVRHRQPWRRVRAIPSSFAERCIDRDEHQRRR